MAKREPIRYVAEFIRTLHRDLQLVSRPDPGFAWWLSRDDQTLFFSARDRRTYVDVLDQLAGAFTKAGDLSRRSVEVFLQDAIFEALDLPKKRPGAFDERLSKTTLRLLERLSRPPVPYRCFIQVDGFDPKDLPLSFGGLRFVTLGESQLRQLRMTKGKRPRTGPLSGADLVGKPCAVVRVKARDFESARLRARERMGSALDCLNFIGGLVPYNFGWLRHPGAAFRANEVASAVSADGQSHVMLSVAGPIAPFSVENLRKNRRASAMMRSLSSLFQACGPERKSVGGVLLASVRWAGRALVELNREQAFLLFAIALESSVLPAQHPEQTYRLSLRLARLLSRGPERRKEVKTMVTRLYGVRSAVVHSGSYQVTDEDLWRLRSLATEVLSRLLRQRKLLNATAETLEEWWERLSLRSS